MAFHLNGYSNFHDDNQDWIVSKIKSIEDTEAHTEELAEAAQASADASQLSAEASQASAEASQLSAEAAQNSASDSQESAEASAASELSAKNYADHIADPVSGLVTDWLNDHVTPTTPIVDDTLTIAGAAADAKATGDEINELKTNLSTITGNAPIVFTPGYYINTAGSTVDVTSPVSSGSGYGYAVINVSEGDMFTVNSSGGSNARAWCFIDSSGTVLDRAASGAIASNVLLKTPAGADKLVINAKNTDDPSYYGQLVSDAINELHDITTDEVKCNFEVGGLSTSSINPGTETDNIARARTGFFDTTPGAVAFFDWSNVSGFVLVYIFQYYDGEYVSKTTTATIDSGTLRFPVSNNANQCRFVIKKSDNSDITDNDLVNVYIPTIGTIDVIFKDKIEKIEEEVESVAMAAGHIYPNEEQYIFSRDVIPYAEMTDLFNGLDTNLKFVDFYDKFHELYTTYAASNPVLEEINIGSQIAETVPAYFSTVPGVGMFMWHIPPLPDNEYQPANTYKRLKVFLTSGIHGSERNAIVTIYAFMHLLLQGYGDIPQAFRNLDFYIMPLCNPYGIENNSSYNGNDININRDFPVRNWQADTADHSNTEPDSQYETKCIIYAINQINPDVLIDHHCFSGNVAGAIKRLYWGTSAYGITVSKLYEVFSQLNCQVRQNFTNLFENYNFIYAYTRYVSDSSGTLSRWSCEQGINGATVECPNTLKWDEDQGYIWATGNDDQRDLVSVSEMYFTNALKVMCDIKEFLANRGFDFVI